MFLIKNGRVVDGTGNPSFYADVAIEDDEIKQIGRKLEVKADRVIDAEGLDVLPGLISPHGHVDTYVLFQKDTLGNISQGVTTDMAGLCGHSLFPDKKTYVESIETALPICAEPFHYTQSVTKAGYDWNSLQEWGKLVMETGGISFNIVPFLGLTSILWKVGYREWQRERKLTPEEMKKVKELIRRGAEEGAAGFSLSRDYIPQRFVNEEDLIEILKVVSEYNLPFMPHIKKVGSPEGVREAVEIARKSGVRVHIGHLNFTPYFFSGKVDLLPEMLGIIDSAREEGIDVTFDVLQQQASLARAYRVDYFLETFVFSVVCGFALKPVKGADTLPTFLENLKDADFRKEVRKTFLESVDRMMPFYEVLYSEHVGVITIYGTRDDTLDGKSIWEIAKREGIKPEDLFFDIIFGVSPLIPKDITPYIELPLYSLKHRAAATDHWGGGPGGDPPPMSIPPEIVVQWEVYETFPKYYREAIARGVRMEEAVKKMTSFPANCFELWDRGILRGGMKADIVVIHPEEFSRPAVSILHPNAKIPGVRYVIVNGTLVIDNEKPTGARPGKILFRK